MPVCPLGIIIVKDRPVTMSFGDCDVQKLGRTVETVGID
jgi:hypothetical protein